MTRSRLWYVIAGLIGAVGLAIGVGTLVTGTSSPRDFVAGHYARAERFDDGTARAYTSSLAPSAVAAQIRGAWRPANETSDVSGTFLRYSRDAVVILPRATGSLIMVDDAQRVYRHYYGVVGSSWGSSDGRGQLVRGGGPGAGK